MLDLNQYLAVAIGVGLLAVILVPVLVPLSNRAVRRVVLGTAVLFVGWTALALVTFRDPRGPGLLRYLVRSYPYWTFGIGGVLLVTVLVGMLAPISDRAIRRAVHGLTAFFLGWTALAALTYLGVMPESPWWFLLNVTSVGLIFHLAWWLAAIALVAVFWVVNRTRFPRPAPGH